MLQPGVAEEARPIGFGGNVLSEAVEEIPPPQAFRSGSFHEHLRDRADRLRKGARGALDVIGRNRIMAR